MFAGGLLSFGTAFSGASKLPSLLGVEFSCAPATAHVATTMSKASRSISIPGNRNWLDVDFFKDSHEARIRIDLAQSGKAFRSDYVIAGSYKLASIRVRVRRITHTRRLIEPHTVSVPKSRTCKAGPSQTSKVWPARAQRHAALPKEKAAVRAWDGG
jgi:hypothetical protein